MFSPHRFCFLVEDESFLCGFFFASGTLNLTLMKKEIENQNTAFTQEVVYDFGM